MTNLLKGATIVGGMALLAATAVDTLAVIGRNIGLPLNGSIELMQAVVLVSGALSLVIAAIEGSHAHVSLVVDRLPPAGQAWAARLATALTLLFFLALLAGSLWLQFDLWHAHEQSEIIGVPWRVLRLVANTCLVLTLLVLLRRLFAGPVREEGA
ncbi:hypothetical protein PK98_03495 [Croceibacterium mercuriale]|uniref:TRAP transporter small permease protein n=1 Tax=Croceibacterium mercuriale TaxID=1572751 RepID=A0A0B2BWD3_9SPHN|nr:TRAP transporter small permease subunit [Croceibacterium mercuriale]KHL25714.1 hypothetical protein PK98_03495 [Croceibacterium mercuriale]